MSKYIDIAAANQILGNIYNNIELVDDEQFPISLNDFDDQFHKTLYSIFFELYCDGALEVSLIEINDYLETRPKLQGIYKNNNGDEFLKDISNLAQISSFEYYYKRLKKFSLLRAYDKNGINIKDIYDPDILDAAQQQAQNEWLDKHDLNEIADYVEDKALEIRQKFVDGNINEIKPMSYGLNETLDRLLEAPVYGAPLFGKYINSICRGARLGEFYLRSGSAGLGKSRSLVANSCMIGLDRYYSIEEQKWIFTNKGLPTLYITTEQTKQEIDTMVLAFTAGVPEHKILDSNWTEEEYKRLQEAIQVIENSPLYIQELPDFTVNDIYSTIKRGIKKYGCRYVMLDYIHSSIAVLSEIAQQSKGSKLREDQVLFMLSDKLKQIAVKEKVFIMSGTQLNDNYMQGILDQNALRGAKALGDKISYGEIMVSVNEKMRKVIEPIVERLGCEMPKIVISVYKNRRGRWNNIYLWCKDLRDVCQIQPMFVTSNNYELIEDIYDTKIIYNEDKEKFLTDKQNMDERAF